jgi:AcrR family transcriptional regulator
MDGMILLDVHATAQTRPPPSQDWAGGVSALIHHRLDVAKREGMAETVARSVRGRRSQAERSDQAVAALRAAALEMLLEGGVAALNLSELGERAGYSRGIAHYHFGSKDALLVDLLDSLTESGRSAFEHLEAGGLDGLLQFINGLAQLAIEDPKKSLASVLLLNEASASDSDRLKKVAINYNNAVREAFERLLASDPKIGVPGVSTPQLAMLVLSGIRGLHHQWLAEREAFDVVAGLHSLWAVIAAAAGRSA